MSSSQLSAAHVGSRLRIARETAGMTQAKAADLVGLARTSLVAVEKGERRARTSELQRLARAYGTTVNTILRREAAFVEFTPRFRKLASRAESHCSEAAELLERLVRAEVELESLLGVRRSFNFPPERPLLGGDVVSQAEQDATELRHWLGLGLAPVRDMLSLLELDLGLRVYIRPLALEVSGLFAFEDTCGACMLLNAEHSVGRRNQTAARGLGHFMSSRGTASIMCAKRPGKSPEERYGDVFARTFLTPVRTVAQRFREITAGSSRLTRQHVIVLASYFGVSPETMVRRLEEVGVARRGTWDWFEENGGVTHQDGPEVPAGTAAQAVAPLPAPRSDTLRIDLLAAEAWRTELLSEGQLAALLQLGRVQLRKLLDAAEEERSVVAGAPELLG